MKHNICQISPIPFNIEHESDYKSSSIQYPLPDGTIISVGRSRTLSTEVLFRPFLIGDESPGFHQLLFDVIRTVDHEVRKKIYKNIVLSGGNTLFEGFEARLMYEMKLLTGNQANIKK
uniref:Beta-centractin (Trinotate prediction) n=1 Tax=Myxobolus squamalis TaxID=59785 RepID=A0A6B2FXK8_MYXSQ